MGFRVEDLGSRLSVVNVLLPTITTLRLLGVGSRVYVLRPGVSGLGFRG